MTITESLQEIKTIFARLEKKRNALTAYIARDTRARDPFESSGGSAKYIREERQSIGDLENRVIRLRTAIQWANLNSTLDINGVTRSVAQWLTWRREVSSGQVQFIGRLLGGIQSVRAEIQRKGGKVVSVVSNEVNLGSDALPEAIVNVDERALLEEQDQLANILGLLDGKLSLFNAVTNIEV